MASSKISGRKILERDTAGEGKKTSLINFNILYCGGCKKFIPFQSSHYKTYKEM